MKTRHLHVKKKVQNQTPVVQISAFFAETKVTNMPRMHRELQPGERHAAFIQLSQEIDPNGPASLRRGHAAKWPNFSMLTGV